MAIFLEDKMVDFIELPEFYSMNLYSYFLQENKQDDIIVIYDCQEFYGVCTYGLLLSAEGVRENCICRDKAVIGKNIWENLQDIFENNKDAKYVPVFSQNGDLIYFAFENKTVDFCIPEITAIASNQEWPFLKVLSSDLEVLILEDMNQITYQLYSLAKTREIEVVTLGERWESFGIKNNPEKLLAYPSYAYLRVNQIPNNFFGENLWNEEKNIAYLYENIHKIFLINSMAEAVLRAGNYEVTRENILKTAIEIKKQIVKNREKFQALCNELPEKISLRNIRTFLPADGGYYFLLNLKQTYDKKIACFYGTCHIIVLNDIFSKVVGFMDKYMLLYIEPIHVMETCEISSQPYQAIDLLIYQNISKDNSFGKRFSTDAIKENIFSQCRTCCIPYAYFDGYFPQLDNSKNKKRVRSIFIKKGGIVLFPGIDNNIEIVYEKEKNIQKTQHILGDLNFYRGKEEMIIQKAEKSFMELEKRETEFCDIIISDFIRKNWKKERLFTEPSHPANRIFRELSKRILEYIDVKGVICDNSKKSLSISNVLIYPSVSKILGLEFTVAGYYAHKEIYDAELSFDDYIELYIRNYTDFDEMY